MRLFVFLHILWLFSSLPQGTKQINLKQVALASDTMEWPRPPVFKGDTLYFLVDRNSPEVEFNEYYVNNSNFPNKNYDWIFNIPVLSFGKIHNKEFTFYCYQPPKPSWQYCHIERKPLSFLDSINHYKISNFFPYDRGFIEIVNSNYTGGLVQPPKARLLDWGTIRNDSITMYEVVLYWYEDDFE